MDLKGLYKKFEAFHDSLFRARYRREILGEVREQEDLFLLLTFSELMGIPNPVFYYMLELYPYLLEDYHRWHLRMGMDRSPLDRFRCC